MEIRGKRSRRLGQDRMKRIKKKEGKRRRESTFSSPFGTGNAFVPQKRWPSFDLRHKDKEVRERKVVVRHGRGVQGEPAERLGGAWGTKVDSQPSETVPGGETKTRSECRTGIGGGGHTWSHHWVKVQEGGVVYGAHSHEVW